MAVANEAETYRSTLPAKADRTWLPHIWLGGGLWTWIQLLVRNRFRLQWRHCHVVAIGMVVCLLNSILGVLQRIIYGRRIRRTPLLPPIFILGHWRTGTTLLHELMSLDPRHAFPTSYQCFLPNHFLLTEKVISKCLWFLVPTKRPMDNMAAGWDRPQEDEFALCLLGQPSPYLTIAFPNHGPAFGPYLDLESLSPRTLSLWRHALLRFLQAVSLRSRKRLVLKSPPHTCRIKVLKEMFPKAIFIHITRNPYVVFPSTIRLWKSLYHKQGMQDPNFVGLENHVFETYLHMHAKLEETRHLINEDRFYELRYEDLVRNPVEEMRALYQHLNLGEFDEVLPKLESYLESVAGYETNHYRLTSRQRDEITRRWGEIIEHFGYEYQSKETYLRRAG